ncbi:serine protease family S09X [Achlya hypogyna]|uniref:Serine protease family S09X n=1 Tax=Achlya hypogyna TaxID=1202772 RepID=A0A1V9YY55_ACHHY|nr:serine protease family S09X [Achlya hypogyna]
MRARSHVRIGIGGQRSLLGLLSATNAPSTSIAVYFHGFPDLSVHPDEGAPPEYASRFPRKLEEALEMDILSVNFSGLPGSDAEASYRTKTLQRELVDAQGVVAYCATELRKAHVHVVGLSTGAILAACLRSFDHPQLRTIAVIAGIADAVAGMSLDFSPQQLAAMDSEGYCSHGFYWPKDWPLAEDCVKDESFESTYKVWRPLDRAYTDGMATLDIRQHVASGTVPFLVIHGSADKSVSVNHGQNLFATAAEPKQWLLIKGANHLLTNTSHMKKALNAIVAHITRAVT